MELKLNPQNILSLWRKTSLLPGGKWLFSRLVSQFIPYTGALGAEVQELSEGWAKITLRDRRGVRNHLSSIHAMAQANLGEMATGFALISGLPTGLRGIVTGFEINYLKKARGRLTATARVIYPEQPEHQPDWEVLGEIVDEQNTLVSTVKARWRIGKQK